ncbi:MAG: hypothetical protein RLZZ135_810, partial [Cyanobacteriota bacterium]
MNMTIAKKQMKDIGTWMQVEQPAE